ncbi:hypothetical protein [Caenimonas sp. SL110]|uniref:hypothetical protein n=1 Tax=Caenimonas sp. SL110 TaxID=1450524 RepID=UPI0006541B00|nr:hypothetical protein [Caenimonas sp. SL110]
MERALLCRPQGGLNDMLSRIEVCCRYAERSGRRVIVDANFGGPSTFNDDLRHYFESLQSRLLLGLDETPEALDAATVAPEFLQGRVSTYQAQRRPRPAPGERREGDLAAWIDTQTGKLLSFDMNRSHPHDLLVHHADGRNEVAMFALLRMRLTSKVADELKRRLIAMAGAYDAVHVRHTDYRSDYLPILEQLRDATPGKLFVATDNAAVLHEFRQALGEHRVFSFSSLPAQAGEPLHRTASAATDLFNRNRDAIVDLLMLALSRQLMVVKLQAGSGYAYSGYSELAKRLWSSRIVLKHLIARDDIQLGLD